MPADLPEDAVRIRNLYPITHCDRSVWAKIISLTKNGDAGDIAKAEAIAYACTNKTMRTRALHTGTVRKRSLRRKFLANQKAEERPIAAMLRALSDQVGTIIMRNSKGGVIPSSRYAAVIAAITDRNKEAYKGIAKSFQGSLRGSVKTGLLHSMQNAEAVVRHVRAAREGVDYVEDLEADLVHLEEADPLIQTLTYTANDSVFKKLFKGALKDTMTAGLFGGNKVSSRVWDLRDGNMIQMKRIVSGGIARGDDPATISRAIRGLLVQPKTLRGFARQDATPGAGAYRSAYANAMRLTRTETNRAYMLSDALFAENKGWNVIWTVSTGQREADECDALGGKEMTPEEFADNYPLHPHDLCYSVLAPKTEFDSPLSDTPAGS